MEDRYQEITAKYDLIIYSTYRTRGALLLETDQGLKLVCNYEGSESRLEFEDELKSHIVKQGYFFVDSIFRNSAGKLMTANSCGENFVIKDWYDGEECSLKKDDKIRLAAANLAELHCCMTGFQMSEDKRAFVQTNLKEQFEKRTRELKRVKTYIRERKQKNNFEVAYLSVCEAFYQDAIMAMKLLNDLPFEEMLQEAVKEGCICHGNYTYHNILLLSNSASNDALCQAAQIDDYSRMLVTTNFEKAAAGLQVMDLYQFIRKAMEKNDWNIHVGDHILDEYQQIRPLSKNELRLLYILLLFPEKFWKITNFYYNSKKSWIPQKNVQKLLALSDQIQQKNKFLNRIELMLR